MSICRFCEKEVRNEESVAVHSYWGGNEFICHQSCKNEGIKQEAFDCQVIDADCNDCKFFKRGVLIKRLLSCMENDKPSKKLVNMEIFDGHCLKFNKPTLAYPNKWTGRECFEHRRG